MEMNEIKESAKNYLDTRLKNPYFASVIFVWLITNRVLVYGIFNLPSTMTVDQKVDWAHNQFDAFNKFGLHGFWGVAIWSLVWGYIAMLAFNKINGFGKFLFKWSNKSTTSMLRRIEPEKWVDLETYSSIENKLNSMENELVKKKLDFNSLQRQYDEIEEKFKNYKIRNPESDQDSGDKIIDKNHKAKFKYYNAFRPDGTKKEGVNRIEFDDNGNEVTREYMPKGLPANVKITWATNSEINKHGVVYPHVNDNRLTDENT